MSKNELSKRRILLFLSGAPSAQDKALARQRGLIIRDPRSYRVGDYLESCDGVAGDVPAAYAERYPVISRDELFPLQDDAVKADGGGVSTLEPEPEPVPAPVTEEIAEPRPNTRARR